MAYGGPASLDQVETYFTHIRGGKKPPPERLADLKARYEAIGGVSPLLKITQSQASGLERVLQSRGGAKVYAGMKHSPPFIGDVMQQANSDGVTDLLCIALAPHYSSISIGGYARAVEEGNQKLSAPMNVTFVKSWHNNPKMVAMWADRVRESGKTAGADASLVFSAHSLPERIIKEGDPYKDQLLESSRLIVDEAGWSDWSFTFQSQSKTGEPWLGPDILDHLGSLRSQGKRKFISAPIGFVSDHLEILYDIDVEAKDWASKNGAELTRCRSPNDSPEMLDCLADIAQQNGFA